MPWARFDDNCPEDPKIDSLSDGAFRLWFNSICYANRNLTDGYIPSQRIARLTPRYKAAHRTELIESGRWHKEEDGIRIHDYLDYQPSAKVVAEQREYEKQKKAKQRSAGGTARSSQGDRSAQGQYRPPDVSPGDTQGDDQRDDQRDSTGDNKGDGLRDSRGVSSSSRPDPYLVLSSRSYSHLLGDARSESENRKAEAVAQRVDALLGAANGKPQAATEATASVVQWAASRLDLTVLDEATGYLETLTLPPRTHSYVAKTWRAWAQQRGVTMPPWTPPTTSGS
jgi:hypothetical protein